MKEKDGEEYAIEVQDVYKTFNVYLDKANSLKEKMLFWKRNKKEVREVLKGINLNIKKGEAGRKEPSGITAAIKGKADRHERGQRNKIVCQYRRSERFRRCFTE